MRSLSLQSPSVSQQDVEQYQAPRLRQLRRESQGIRSSVDSDAHVVDRSNQLDINASRFAGDASQDNLNPNEDEPPPSGGEVSRRAMIENQQRMLRQLNLVPNQQNLEAGVDQYPGISIIEPSNPDVVLTVAEFINLRLQRLSKMVAHVNQLALYFLVHCIFSLVLGLRLALHIHADFEYSLCVFMPFYLGKFVYSIRVVSHTQNRKDKTYYTIGAVNNVLLFIAVISLIVKTNQPDDFSFLYYVVPMILAAILRAFKSPGDASPCFSLLQLFKTMGVVLRVALVVTLSVKYQDYIGWSWSSAFWPFWCSLAIQGVMIIFTLILLLWSLVMYCRKTYPLSFLLGALWAFFITYGFSITFTWFIINTVRALNEAGLTMTEEEVGQQIAKNLIYVFLFLLLSTIFTFSSRKTLPYWFERMLYSPAELEQEQSFDFGDPDNAPTISERKYFTPKFITRITNAYFRKSKAHQRQKAQEWIRKKNREAIVRNTRAKRVNALDEHQTSMTAGILMSSTADYMTRSIERFDEPTKREGLLSVKNSTTALKFSHGEISETSTPKRQLPHSSNNRRAVRFNFPVASGPKRTTGGGGGLSSLFKMFKKGGGKKKQDQRRVGVNDAKDIDNLKAQECCICLSSAPNCVLMECGHGSLCYPCGQKLIRSNQRCPLCRDDIKAVLKVDLVSVSGKTLRVQSCLFKENSRDEKMREIIDSEESGAPSSFRPRRSSLPSRRVNQEEIKEELSESSEPAQPSEDPFELFSFRKQNESRNEMMEEDEQEEKSNDIGYEITPQRRDILVELEQDLASLDVERPTTVVGLKRIHFLEED